MFYIRELNPQSNDTQKSRAVLAESEISGGVLRAFNFSYPRNLTIPIRLVSNESSKHEEPFKKNLLMALFKQELQPYLFFLILDGVFFFRYPKVD